MSVQFPVNNNFKNQAQTDNPPEDLSMVDAAQVVEYHTY